MSMSTRTEILIGPEGIEKLKDASVVLVGCGAVGGYALEGMVRAGIGRIRVYDHDVFSDSNLNRQILATTETLGVRKVDAACDRARIINPDIDIEGKDVLVNQDTVPEILSGDFDVLVDAIDTVRNKSALLMKTDTCPIAANLRKSLRDCDTSRITAVYSKEPPLVKPTEKDDHGKSVLGSLPTVPAIFGMTLANEVIKYILRE